MDITELLPDSCRKTANNAADILISKPHLFEEFLKATHHKNETLAMRSSRVIQITYMEKPEVINPHLSTLFKNLLLLKTQGTIRSLLYIFKTGWELLDEEEFGLLIDFAFQRFEDVNSETSVRVYSLILLNNVAVKKLPQIKGELKRLIEFHYQDGSPALKAVIRNTLKLYR